jgi:hypothetical protein
MKKILLPVLLLFSITSYTQSWISLLDKNSLAGWKVPENNIWYSVKNGILHIQSGPDKKGSILWTDKNFQNFKIKLQFKMGDGTVDSGVFLRGENDQIQIGISGSLKRDMTASPYIPKLRYPVEAKDVAKILKPKDWNSMQIEVIDKTYSVLLNNKLVMTYTSEGIPSEGPIGLQLHPGNEMSIDYKKIKLKIHKS